MVRIFSDSTCDLSDELLKRYDITLLPLYIILGDEQYKDRVNITPQDIFKWSDEHKTTPKTSAASLEDITEKIKPVLDAGDEIIAFSISLEMSNMGNVIRLAAQALDAEDRVHYIDSRNLSTGIGHLVVEAAVMAQSGKTADEIVAEIQKLIPRVRASFVVDTLTYLHRGGRCGGLAALAGSVLRLHPKIMVKDGVMGAGKKYRGKYDKVLIQYMEDTLGKYDNIDPDRVFVTHAGMDPELVNTVVEAVKAKNIFKEVLITRASCTISSHCGPHTLGVLFMTK